MTANELKKYFNNTYNTLDKEWPKTFEVDAETYANCCQEIFNTKQKIRLNGILWMEVSVGDNNGLMFKNIELIYRSKI